MATTDQTTRRVTGPSAAARSRCPTAGQTRSPMEPLAGASIHEQLPGFTSVTRRSTWENGSSASRSHRADRRCRVSNRPAERALVRPPRAARTARMGTQLPWTAMVRQTASDPATARGGSATCAGLPGGCARTACRRSADRSGASDRCRRADTRGARSRTAIARALALRLSKGHRANTGIRRRATCVHVSNTRASQRGRPIEAARQAAGVGGRILEPRRDAALVFHPRERDIDGAAFEAALRRRHELEAVTCRRARRGASRISVSRRQGRKCARRREA